MWVPHAPTAGASKYWLPPKQVMPSTMATITGGMPASRMSRSNMSGKFPKCQS